MAVDVSVIFVNYNTVSLLIDAIDTVLNKTLDIKYEIIVVDNNSNDNSKSILWHKYGQKVNYIDLSENIGFGRANNEGMKKAAGRNVFLLNPDTLLNNNAIKILSNYLDANKQVGVVGASLYNEDGSPQASYSFFYPSLSYEFSNLLHLSFLFNTETFNDSVFPKEVKRVVGAAMMIKKEVIEKVGMFDPRFFMYAEEDEWCYRITKAGYKLVNLPESSITHLDGKSFLFSEQRKLRQLEGIRTFYKVTYSPLYCEFLKCIEYLTIVNRLFIFRLLKHTEKVNYWKFMYAHRKWK
ncbi:Poly(ribitol-phosphate) beta-N-acetylglucosaminyltransferase TarP [Flavobacterium bizetiae]|uniref:Poly(Ribitol-phosphate) beta-N-acetylglucosaminyltransferase TarP n=1 Tax=Flavobacterium bizetiae TaxID=2704140 RepID=A0A6J4GXR8_9FLAO|nr:glycosyltransferase family 2 protein [Flavobacterium bizetiae]CAA9203702.1 Poly(ribitol-phosphate) beta-N-acetylglucosaminyltransferase TarP [Flavobacterium bizetiae]CAD5344721.1 Poly(ribitol-phosphate) beta-N-acetylglucosaminyltransferase TarP [Flavobacterium bizetiae]CAD5350994.1 Poly(ribitol-phosphate) beta-N-acetylglucosaminyltransferase TarP [Flavobacterium bizetiae]